jgi:hypothetical protein
MTERGLGISPEKLSFPPSVPSGENAMTTTDIAGLLKKLWVGCIYMRDSNTNCVVDPKKTDALLANAARTIERQAAEIERLRGALEVARHALVCTENLRCTDQSIEALAAKLVNGVPRDQLEFVTNFASELAVIEAALTGEDV